MEWKVYAENKTCYVFRDGALVDRYTILKQQGDGIAVYNRGTNDKTETPPVEKMKLIASTTGDILYDRTQGLHFHGLAKKVEEAGEIAHVSQLPPETVQSYKTMAKVCIEQARICLSIGPAFRENARRVLIEIDKYDPDNEEYRALLKTLV